LGSALPAARYAGRVPGSRTVESKGSQMNGPLVRVICNPASGGGLRQETRAVESGALVVGVDPNGPAAKTGIEVGNVITGIDDRKVEDVGDLLAALRGYRPGDEVEIATSAKG